MIIVKLQGGLGNQMFQYAFGRYLQKKYVTNIKLDLTSLQSKKLVKGYPVREFELDIFKIGCDLADKNEIKSFRFVQGGLGIISKIIYKLKKKFFKEPKVFYEKQFHFDSAALEAGDNKYYDGHWQTEKYFPYMEKQLRKDFSLKGNITNKYLNTVKNDILNCNSVCVHIRRGDFLTNPTHGFVGLEYIVSAMKKIKGKIDPEKIGNLGPSIKFFIFSDDIEWCKSHIQSKEEIYFVMDSPNKEKSGIILEIMKNCKHFIISNSSFSWWAAWLSENPEKIVIAPKRWFHEFDTDTCDLIPERWIKI